MSAHLPIMLIIFMTPAPQHQWGQFEFATKAACERAAPAEVVLNSKLYPRSRFQHWACKNSREDLP